jgi:hypothetical protein
VRYSVLLSLHDRDIVDLQKTFKQLAKADSGRNDVEFVIAYDFAEGEFDHVETLAEIFSESIGETPCTIIRYDTMAENPGTFNLDGHNNPVAVNNALMDAAKGENLVWVSSDMIVSPLLFERIDKHIDPSTGLLDTVWCSRVLDQDAMAEFCGPSRPFPMMWCIAHPATGERHDLELLKGFGFDDNDWVARMAMKTGSVTIDLLHVAIHQTHGRVSQIGQLASGKAYSEEAKPGWVRTTKYIQTKWGGCPFDGKTLDVEYGEIGDFIIINVNGVKKGPDYPLSPQAAVAEAFPPPKPKRKKVAKKKVTRKKRVKKNA